MSGTVAYPRRGLADRAWPYRAAVDTDVAATFAAERARLAAAPPACDTHAERSALRDAIAEHCDAMDAPAFMPPRREMWDFTAYMARKQAGRINTDDAVALLALSALAAACRFGGMFG